MIEYLNVVFGRVSTSLILRYVVDRSHKSDKFAGYNPVEIAIFDLFVIFIFFVIKLSEVVPTKFYGIFETFKAVLNSTRVRAINSI